VAILSHYALGSYVSSQPVSEGTVQTNYFLETTEGRFVFRAYENRSKESVLFEIHLLNYLKKHDYPCPAPFKGTQGNYVGSYHHKPYAIFEFMQGHPVDQPNEQHRQQLIQKAAELQKLTHSYRPRYKEYRWNYGVELCRKLAQEAAAKIDTQDALEKLAWHEQQLSALELPRTLPKGICHCDFHFSNVLFQGNQFAALLDFDDANYTFLLFDLVGLIESAAWEYPSNSLDLVQARNVVQEYRKYRPLNAIEQHHLYDAYKLSILIDCVWYFGRDNANDFYEKRKVEFLNNLGRTRFFDAFFLES
jgi:homoserine kinase